MPGIPYIPFRFSHPQIKNELLNTFDQFIEDQDYILGKRLEQFEREYAAFNETKYAIGVGNGHDAFLVILKALGIGQGDEVIIPAHTFFATALSIVNAGATPVLVDIDKNMLNIDPGQIEKRISKNTKAIVPVHIYGSPCNMDQITSIAEKHNIHVIEDNAQAHGALFRSEKTGSIGIMNFTSFYPTKNLGALGDGGAITTNSKELYLKAKSMRNYGKSEKGEFVHLGINSRLDELHARILTVKLKYLNEWNNERAKIAHWYFDDLEGVKKLRLQKSIPYTTSVYHIFPILSRERDELRKHLKSEGIDTLIHYEKPIHFHDVFSFLKHEKGDFPVAEDICSQELSLPIYPGLTKQEVHFICNSIKAFYSK